MPAYQRGSITVDGHKLLRDTYGEDAWQRVLASLTPEELEQVRNVEKVPQYPLALEGKIFEGIARECCAGDANRLGSDFRFLGRKQADNMLDGVFSIFARFASPKQAFDRAGSIISTTYTGVTSETVRADVGNGGVIYIRGLGEANYLAPWLVGWMERALERFGANSPQVRERCWERGQTSSDEFAFEITWE